MRKSNARVDGSKNVSGPIEFPVLDPTSPYQPRKQFYVEALSRGEIVSIRRRGEYNVFFRLFSRYCDYNGLKMNLSLRQVQPDLWHLVPWKTNAKKPGSLLEGPFRKHGRYKFYAAQLREGHQVVLDTLDDFQRVQFGVNRYIPIAERAGLELRALKNTGKAKKIVVRLVPKSGNAA